MMEKVEYEEAIAKQNACQMQKRKEIENQSHKCFREYEGNCEWIGD